ncbi:site-specific integrase [Hymenobacter tibetensis]|uniref:Site-specific integrase n=1 Tax=Hymenobacter tibetensis TaxID=497967 RepID=A0ABY4D5C8_9BACT|nr:phage integrase SAM-like domain-containing protein [Hymenobacter tibetensis]UOG76770.1 site-specific integrase [Hymenobacter tibetensis]
MADLVERLFLGVLVVEEGLAAGWSFFVYDNQVVRYVFGPYEVDNKSGMYHYSGWVCTIFALEWYRAGTEFYLCTSIQATLMATITVFVRKVNTRIPQQPLGVKFRHGAAGKCELVISTGYQILPDSLRNGRVNGDNAKVINGLLHHIQSDLMEAYDNLGKRKVPVERETMRQEYLLVKTNREAEKTREKRELFTVELETGKEAIDSKLQEYNIQQQIKQLEQQLNQLKEQTKEKVKTWDAASRKAGIPDLEEELTQVAVETGFIQAPTHSKEDLFVTYFERYNTKGKNKVADTTIRNLKTVAQMVERFHPSLRIQDVTRDTLQQLEGFMVGEGILNQSIQTYMSKVKSVLRYYAHDLNLNTSYERYRFELLISKPNVVFLHPYQLREFMNHKIDSNKKGHDRMKDIMLMLISTGFRISDVFINFKDKLQVKTEFDGKQREFIQIIPQKTKGKQITATVPVTKLMKEILERNNYQLRKMEDYYFIELLREYCQGIPSFQREVATIKYCGKREIITKEKLCDAIGSHIGRKTNISYLFALDTPTPEIMGRSGHTDYTTLMLYGQKLDDIKAAVRELDFFALAD